MSGALSDGEQADVERKREQSRKSRQLACSARHKHAALVLYMRNAGDRLAAADMLQVDMLHHHCVAVNCHI